MFNNERYQKLVDRFLAGKPVELTDASPEVAKLRGILEGDCVIGEVPFELDVSGDVYWNDRRSVAVLVSN